MNNLAQSAALAAITGIVSGAVTLAAPNAVDELIAKIKDHDDKVRGPAWQSAAPLGAPAVKGLAATMADADMEIARAAKRALWKIVRYAGRPGADPEKKAVAKELVALLDQQPMPVRREALWMLSEIGGADAVPAIAGLLSPTETREDARAALERIPGEASIAALKAALVSGPEDFKPAVAQSLRVRGVKVNGYPSQKLVPTRPVPGAVPKAS